MALSGKTVGTLDKNKKQEHEFIAAACWAKCCQEGEEENRRWGRSERYTTRN